MNIFNRYYKFLFIVSVFTIGSLKADAQFEKYRWTTLGTIGKPVGRHENAFVEYNGKFYLLGGRGINPVNVFDPQTKRWESKQKPPMELHHFQAVVYHKSIYLLGAMTGEYPNELPLENIWIYYPETDTWKQGPEIPKDRQRGGAGAVLYNDKIYLAGGIKLGHTSGTCNYFDCFDPKTGKWETLNDAPHIRDHFSAIIADDKLYCIGGRNTSVHHPDNFSAFFNSTIPEVDYYDFKNETWYTLKELLPFPTAAGGIVKLGHYLIYMGGEGSQSQAYNQTQCLDINTGKWTQLTPLNMGRHGTNAVLFNEEIYIAAGSENKGGGNLNTMEVFSSNHSWKKLFNGEDLTGWQVMCTEQDKGNNFWQVKDGVIECNSLHSKTHNYVWLMSIEEFSDFELRFKFQVPRQNEGNSGMQIRSRYFTEAIVEQNVEGWLDGPQVDIDPNAPFRNGLIYDETRNTKRWIYPSLPDWRISKKDVNHKPRFYFEDEENGWNDMTIICNGFNVITIVNNVVVTNWNGKSILNDKEHQRLNVGRKGHLALQVHKNASNLIRFKNIEIRDVK